MGGVDRFDQMIKYYPIKRKTNRWTNRFTMHTIQILIHNSYVLYKKYYGGIKLDNFDFQCKFIDYLIKDLDFSNNNDTSTTIKQHYPLKSKMRSDCVHCRRKYKKRSTTINKCKQCDVYLCVYGCFSEYHCWDEEEFSTSDTIE